MRDFALTNLGAVYLLRPLTKAAEDYVQEICDEPNYPELWPTLVLEPEEVMTMVEEFYEQGLTFQ